MKYLIIIFGVILIAAIGVFIFRSSGNPDLLTNYPSPNPDVIAYGDSLVEGVGSTDGNDFVSLLSAKIGQPITNLGRSGDTTVDGIARIGELDNYNPKVVLLLLGGNDHLKQIPITETHNNLAILIQNIQARGAVVLLLGVRGGLFNDRFGPEFQNLSQTYHTAFVPDVLAGLFGNVNYMSDAIHPNNAGYQIIADRIYPVLAPLLK
ncbi:MAG: GDSL-type esterase/lipase family protein [Candidatus Paceibacterota bacterium]